MATTSITCEQIELQAFTPDPRYKEGVHEALDQAGPTGEDSCNAESPSVQKIRDPPMNLWRGVSAGTAWFTQGAHDSVAGALLPYIEAEYDTNYTVTSLIFVANAVGFVAASPLVRVLEDKLGRARLLSLAAALNCIAYAVIISRPPFAALAVMYGFLGFGFSFILSLDNSFIAGLHNDALLMGIMQGFYGLGGAVAPLIGTAMASHGIPWSYFYFVTLGLSMACAAMFAWSFRGFVYRPSTTRMPNEEVDTDPSQNMLAKSLRDRSTLLGSLFIFAYQGAEVTISGWVVSFLIDYRHGDPSHVGYVTAGFWAGVTLGRFLLCPLIHHLGDRRCIQVVVLTWAALMLVVWLVPNILGDAVAIGIVGFVSGPVAPVATGVLSRLLDPDIQMTSISFVWSLGSGGAAVAPFITGLLAQRFGTIALNPAVIVLCVVMQVAWFFLPRRTQKSN